MHQNGKKKKSYLKKKGSSFELLEPWKKYISTKNGFQFFLKDHVTLKPGVMAAEY